MAIPVNSGYMEIPKFGNTEMSRRQANPLYIDTKVKPSKPVN